MKESNYPEHERELVTQAQAGDLHSFEILVNQYERRIYQIARRIVEHPQDAEDILQETFLKAFENLPRFRGESSFYTWIVQIAVNAALQRLKTWRRHPTISLDHGAAEDTTDFRPKEIAVWEEDPEKLYSRTETHTILDRAIAALPVIYRTVFLLKDVENLSAEEVAASLGISLAATKSRLIRARLELRESLGKHFRKEGAPVYSGGHHHD